jgi:hypothetical protein
MILSFGIVRKTTSPCLQAYRLIKTLVSITSGVIASLSKFENVITFTILE